MSELKQRHDCEVRIVTQTTRGKRQVRLCHKRAVRRIVYGDTKPITMFWVCASHNYVKRLTHA